MELKIFEDYTKLSDAAATMVIECIKNKPGAILCFASGDTPKLACQLIAEMAKKENINLSKCFFIGLDEWLGIEPENTGSCHYFFQQYLFAPSGIDRSQVHLFDALATNAEEECKKMNRIIEEKGGIDLMVVGVGMNGHIGFNEPGTDIDSISHVALLDEITKNIGQKYFNQTVTINKGITVGLKQIMQAKKLLMMANGKKKAPVIKRAVEGEISIDFPAGLIRRHNNGILMVDTEAASELERM
ncbi:MAG: glucosamine-6-phosphate deaminase [Bacteroidota bacterium]